MKNKILLTSYVDGVVRITGGVLDGVECLAWQPPHGRRLIYLNEVGHLHSQRLSGLILVRSQDVLARDKDMARRACITNSRDLAATLQALRDGSPVSPPDNFWLGVMPGPDVKMHGGEPDLPVWALGHELIEAGKPYGDFGALGYGRKCGRDRFQVAKQYYCEILCPEVLDRI